MVYYFTPIFFLNPGIGLTVPMKDTVRPLWQVIYIGYIP